jgi:hypothetical protein
MNVFFSKSGISLLGAMISGPERKKSRVRK